MIILIAAVGEDPNLDFLSKLACHFQGIVVPVEKKVSQAETATILSPFYQFLSIGLNITKPLWTEPYHDFYLDRLMVTVSMPAYYTEEGAQNSELLGVAGIDILF